MSEIHPLLDDAVSGRVEKLLRSAETDGPASPEAAEARTLAVLGALPSAPTAAPPSTRSVSLSHVLGAGGVLAALAIAVVFTATRSPSAPAAEVPSARHEAQSSSTPAATKVEDLPSAAIAPAVNAPAANGPAANAKEERAVALAPPRSSVGAAVPSSLRLEDELAAIDAARAALASKHPDAALARVQGYQRQFQNGRFTEEADALEIQALAAMGRHAEARAKGERFLASRPGSAYERRVRSSIALGEVKR